MTYCKARTRGGALLVLGTALVVLAGTATAAADDGGGTLEVEVGVGYDSNPFLTPPSSYFDQRAGRVIQPDRRPGFFLPLRLRGEHPMGAGGRFAPSYSLRLDKFTGSDQSNADEIRARFNPGFQWEHTWASGGGTRLYVSPLLIINKETYFDRDSGFDQTSGGQDLSNTYTYRALGAELRYDIRTAGSVRTSLRARVEDRNYEDVAGFTSFDHSYYWVGADVAFDLPGPNRLYLDYRYRVRDYDTRRSRDLTGRILAGNPTLQYDYQDFGLTLRTRATRHWSLYFDVDHRIRDDSFMDYDGYTRDAYRIRSIFHSHGRRLRVAVRYRTKDYGKGFIFDLATNPVDGTPNPNKSYETLDVELGAELPWKGRTYFFGDYRYRDRSSEDPRYGYKRHRLTGGLGWRL